MPSWRVSRKASLSNQITHFGVMGGLSNSRVATHTNRATNTLRIPKPAAAGLQFMRMHNLLSKNPQGSGGVGRMVKTQPCNCTGVVKKTAVTLEDNNVGNDLAIAEEGTTAEGPAAEGTIEEGTPEVTTINGHRAVKLGNAHWCMAYDQDKHCIDADYVCVSGTTSNSIQTCLIGRNFPSCELWKPPELKSCYENNCLDTECAWLANKSNAYALYCPPSVNNSLYNTQSCVQTTNAMRHDINSNTTKALTYTTNSNNNESIEQANLMELYNEWKNTHPEAKHHYLNWYNNHIIIEQHNKNNTGWTKKHNQFSGYTNEEFVQLYENPELQREFELQQELSEPDAYTPSTYTRDAYTRDAYTRSSTTLLSNNTTIDWRDKGAVTAIKDQGSCGGCWSFSSTGAIEGAYQIKTGKLVSLSEQQLLSNVTDNNGCGGGVMSKVYEYFMDNKIQPCLGSDVPYTSSHGYQAPLEEKSCNTNIRVTGFTPIKASHDGTGDEDLFNKLNQGPVSVGIDASGLQFYDSGIYDTSQVVHLDHAVLLVGAGITDDGTKYWIIKNSWGTTWGECGYFRLKRHTDCIKYSLGICRLASRPDVE